MSRTTSTQTRQAAPPSGICQIGQVERMLGNPDVEHAAHVCNGLLTARLSITAPHGGCVVSGCGEGPAASQRASVGGCRCLRLLQQDGCDAVSISNLTALRCWAYGERVGLVRACALESGPVSLHPWWRAKAGPSHALAGLNHSHPTTPRQLPSPIPTPPLLPPYPPRSARPSSASCVATVAGALCHPTRPSYVTTLYPSTASPPISALGDLHTSGVARAGTASAPLLPLCCHH
jgi:hypothetical protein